MDEKDESRHQLLAAKSDIRCSNNNPETHPTKEIKYSTNKQ